MTQNTTYLLTAYTVVAYLVLGLLVLLSNPRSNRNRSFAAMACSVTVWSLAVYYTDHLVGRSITYLWNKITYSDTLIMMIFLVLFIEFLFKDEATLSKWIKIGVIIPGMLLSIIALFTGLIVKDVYLVPSGTAVVFGPMNIFHSLFILVCLGYVAYRLIIGFINARGSKRIQLGYILLGVSLSGVVAFITNVIMPMFFDRFDFAGFGPGATLFMLALTAYAIIKHRLMDISVVISRTVAEILTIIFFGTIYLGLVWLSVNYVSPFINWFFLAWTVVYGIGVGEIFQKTRLFIQTTSDKLFLRGKYDYYQELAEISSQLANSLSLDNVLKTLQKAFYDVIEVSNPRIYLGKEIESPQIKELLSRREPTFRGEELILPCVIEGRLIVLIILGKKLSEEPYTDEDLKLLKNLSNQAAVALDHLRIYEEKLKAQRQLLLEEKLASLGKVASETAREINDSIKKIDRLTARIDESTNNPSFLREFQATVPKEIDHLSSVIDNLLGMAKPR
ncbi:MAG: histidine kinase N-terminal 7TM domain-containing protein [Candidatus Gracilibacteria bacterium]